LIGTGGGRCRKAHPSRRSSPLTRLGTARWFFRAPLPRRPVKKSGAGIAPRAADDDRIIAPVAEETRGRVRFSGRSFVAGALAACGTIRIVRKRQK